MKIHPEMKDTITEAMREGLRFWRKRTPEQIREDVRKKIRAEQGDLFNPKKVLAWGRFYVGCDCGGAFGHYPWCTGHIEFKVWATDPEPEQKGDTVKWSRLGSSPWGGMP
jgi:hypothetical protein